MYSKDRKNKKSPKTSQTNFQRLLTNTGSDKSRIPQEPPHVDSNPHFNTKRRYYSTANTSGNFLIGSGHQQFTNATTAILGSTYVYAWRIKKVTIWSPFLSASQAVGSCELSTVGVDTVNNSFNDPGMVIADTTSSLDVSARVSITTSPETPMGSWHLTNTTNASGPLFGYVMTNGSTMDITFEFVLNQSWNVGSFTSVLVGASAGQLYALKFNANVIPFGVNFI